MTPVANALRLTAVVAMMAGHHGVHASTQQIQVASTGGWGASCDVVLDAAYRCTGETCLIPLSRSRADDIELHLSCLSSAAPTGFENPPPEVRVESVRAGNVRGFMSISKSVAVTGTTQSMDVAFCVFGDGKNFCGSGGAIRKEKGTNVSRVVKKFLRSVKLLEGTKQWICSAVKTGSGRAAPGNKCLPPPAEQVSSWDASRTPRVPARCWDR